MCLRNCRVERITPVIWIVSNKILFNHYHHSHSHSSSSIQASYNPFSLKKTFFIEFAVATAAAGAVAGTDDHRIPRETEEEDPPVCIELRRLTNIIRHGPCTPECGRLCSPECTRLNIETLDRIDALKEDFMMQQAIVCTRQRRHFIDELGRTNNHIFRRLPFEGNGDLGETKRSRSAMEHEKDDHFQLDDILLLDGEADGLNGRILCHLGPVELFAFYRVSRLARRSLCACLYGCVLHMFRVMWCLPISSVSTRYYNRLRCPQSRHGSWHSSAKS